LPPYLLENPNEEGASISRADLSTLVEEYNQIRRDRYEQAKTKIEASIPEGPRGKRAVTKDDFLAAGAMMLPEQSQYDYLANLPEGEVISEAVNEAMKLIEDEYPDLAGVLPKNYQEMDADLLRELIRVFNKDAVKNLTGDVFGRIMNSS
ncbi:type I restriction-modification system subunit M N-terminal domain-containing protein, partial [Altibacter sp.]|uniref:type I restriction-modification system subunit M N-terminal domain-containing protein n=1 Tax=Altibacter sp. TaxID=2024823 RepID=UPI002588DF74